MKCNKSEVMKAAWAYFNKRRQYCWGPYELNKLFREALRIAWIAERARVRFAEYQANAAVAGHEVKPGDVLEIQYGAEDNWTRCTVESVECNLVNVDMRLKVTAIGQSGRPFVFYSRVGELRSYVIASEAIA